MDNSKILFLALFFSTVLFCENSVMKAGGLGGDSDGNDDVNGSLYLACSDGDFDEVQRLIKECKANYTCFDRNGYSPLYNAYDAEQRKDGHRGIIKYFVEKLDYVVCDQDKDDIWYYICMGNDVETLKLFDKKIIKKHFFKLLRLAVSALAFDVYAYLCENCNHKDYIDYDYINRPFGGKKDSMLHTISISPEGNAETKRTWIKYLLMQGANTCAKNVDGRFPSTLALIHGYIDIGKYMQKLEHNNYEGFTKVNEDNRFMDACKRCDFEEILRLVERGVNVKMITKNNELPSTILLRQSRFKRDYDNQIKVILIGIFLQQLERGSKAVLCKPFLDNQRDFCFHCKKEFKPYDVVIMLPCQQYILHPTCLYNRDKEGLTWCRCGDVEENENSLQFMIYDPDETYNNRKKFLLNKCL
jgi:hypothetical protein